MIGDRLPGPVERGVAVTRGSEGLLITRPSPACVTRKEEKGAERRSHEVAYHMRKKQMEKKNKKSGGEFECLEQSGTPRRHNSRGCVAVGGLTRINCNPVAREAGEQGREVVEMYYGEEEEEEQRRPMRVEGGSR